MNRKGLLSELGGGDVRTIVPYKVAGGAVRRFMSQVFCQPIILEGVRGGV